MTATTRLRKTKEPRIWGRGRGRVSCSGLDDDEVEGSSNDETDSEDECYGEGEEFRSGDVVWAKQGRTWYPGKIPPSTDISVELKSRLQKSKTLVPVSWYGENRQSLVQIRSIDHLSQNRVDEKRASKSVDMLVKYNEAVADLRND